MEIEIKDKCAILHISGDVEEIDESFDHAFGVEVIVNHKVLNLQVIACIDDLQYDLVPLMADSTKQLYEHKLIQEYING